MLAKLVLDQGIKTVALTYANNDYATPLATGFATAYKAGGGTITAEVKHEEKQQSYTAELGTLAKDPSRKRWCSSPMPVIRHYHRQGSFENSLFKRFIGTDGLARQQARSSRSAPTTSRLPSHLAVRPGERRCKRSSTSSTPPPIKSSKDKIFIGQTYDSVMLAALAVEKAGWTDREKVRGCARARLPMRLARRSCRANGRRPRS